LALPLSALHCTVRACHDANTTAHLAGAAAAMAAARPAAAGAAAVAAAVARRTRGRVGRAARAAGAAAAATAAPCSATWTGSGVGGRPRGVRARHERRPAQVGATLDCTEAGNEAAYAGLGGAVSGKRACHQEHKSIKEEGAWISAAGRVGASSMAGV